MNVLLQDFSDRSKFYSCKLDPASTFSIDGISVDEVGEIQGFGSWEKLGSVFSKKTFAAIFLSEEQIFAAFKNRIFSLSHPWTHVKLKSLLLGWNELQITHADEVLLRTSYGNPNTDPDGLGGNIFEFMERFSLNDERKSELLKILTSLKAGEFRSQWRDGLLE